MSSVTYHLFLNLGQSSESPELRLDPTSPYRISAGCCSMWAKCKSAKCDLKASRGRPIEATFVVALHVEYANTNTKRPSLANYIHPKCRSLPTVMPESNPIVEGRRAMPKFTPGRMPTKHKYAHKPDCQISLPYACCDKENRLTKYMYVYIHVIYIYIYTYIYIYIYMGP